METFIVLGLCFILYEALDLFQSCYNKERHQQRQQENSGIGGSAGSSNTANSGTANRSSPSDSCCVNKDTAHLVPLEVIDENDLDSDTENAQLNHHLDKSQVYSICDRVISQHFNNNNCNLNNNSVICVDDNDKLIVG